MCCSCWVAAPARSPALPPVKPVPPAGPAGLLRSRGDTGEEPGVGICDCGDPGADDPAAEEGVGELGPPDGRDPDAATPLPAAVAPPAVMAEDLVSAPCGSVVSTMRPLVVAAFREAGMGPSVQVREMVSEKRLCAVLVAAE